MSMNTFLTAIVVASVMALAIWGYVEGRSERSIEAQREAPVKAPSRVSQGAGSGTPTISLSASAQQASGLLTTPQVAVSFRSSQAALATVLAPEDLIGLRTTLIAAQAQAQRAAAEAGASHAEYERSAALHQTDRDVSDKDFEAARASWQADEAALQSAQQSARAAEETARQQWGAVLASAAQENSTLFVGLSKRTQTLLQITLPTGVQISEASREIVVRLPEGGDRIATFLSVAPRTDSRLQGLSFFYTLDTTTLFPGMALNTWLPLGPETQGALIPSSAVVLWQGQAWIYAQRTPEQFERRSLPTDNPTEGGWFVPQGFADGAPIVTTGSQLLLSEEQRAQISVGEEGE